jgi:hydrogenase expression/formation protein HypC
MCLAIPAEIIKIEGNMAKVDFGQGVVRDVNVMLVNAQVGKYVLVHAGYAIQVIEPKEAKETLRLWDEILKESEQTDFNR